MSLHSWLHNERGEWYVAIQIVLMIGVLLAPRLDGQSHNRNPAWPVETMVIGTVLLVCGAIVSMLGGSALGRSLSPYPKPKQNAELVERGIYGIVRHPIYCGIILLAVGWGLFWMSGLALIGAILLFAFFDIKSRREERWLEEKFAGYAAYKRRVKMLIPFVY